MAYERTQEPKRYSPFTIEQTDNQPRKVVTSEPEREQIAQRIRDTINWLRRTPVHTKTPYQNVERTVRDSVRQLSRQRVSDLLRQLRATQGLSYEQVSERTGLTQQLLFDVEFKDRRLSLDEIRLLANCYQVSIDDLLGIDVD